MVRVNEASLISVQVKISVMDCAECGMLFGCTDEFVDRRREDGKAFYCPAGHANVYGNSEVERLQRKLSQSESDRKVLAQRTAKLEGELREATRAAAGLLARAHAGVCPHCHRTFKQLVRHMQAKHPEQVAGEG